MVRVSSQAGLGDRQMDRAIRLSADAVPADQDIEQSQRKCNPGGEALSGPMPSFLEVTHRHQHREGSGASMTDLVSPLTALRAPVETMTSRLWRANKGTARSAIWCV